MNAHTPGPWFNTSEDDQVVGIVGTTPLNNDIAMLWGKKCKADAKLIAAAPDLLAELQHVIQWHDQIDADDVARYRAVVAKATGSAV